MSAARQQRCSAVPDRDRAKHIIREIVRLSGGTVEGKTRLFKTFYLAHLYYANNAPDYLSDWPIVRMPNGPGIHEADSLMTELVAEGAIEVGSTTVGPYSCVVYRSLRDEIPQGLSEDAIIAIREAVAFTRDKSAAELSELTHEHSRSWRMGRDGEELNVYIDLLTDEEYEEGSEKIRQLAKVLEEVWPG